VHPEIQIEDLTNHEAATEPQTSPNAISQQTI